jgi:hypothetical protein
MYGYDLPSYVREYSREWRRYDRFLRVRRSLDTPGQYVLERKTRFIEKFPCQVGTDRQVQYKDEYRPVYHLWPNELTYVLTSLMASDIQAHGGARALANTLDFHDDRVRTLVDRQGHSEFEAAASESYDRLAWLEGRRVSMGGHGV